MRPLGHIPPRAAAVAALALCCLFAAVPRTAAETAAPAAPAVALRPEARPPAAAVTAAATPGATATATPASTPAALPAASRAAPDPGTLQPAAASPAPPAPAGPVLGPETNLPLPRFVSLKTGEGNVRRGPSLSHRIDWVFLRKDMPLQITAEYGHWRRVIDREGQGGWVHYSLLSGSRTVIVDQDLLPLRTSPDPDAPETARLEQGVIARLGRCDPGWCRIGAGGYRGWAPKTALWGVGADEILD
jgi:SH3-like domain-containing protein